MIGGNKELIIQSLMDTSSYDSNGKKIEKYENKLNPILGWLDLMSGDSNYDYKAKIEDSTHIFVCDYVNLETVDIEISRALIENRIFEIKYIDDPMGLHQHLEIYLKLIGGQPDEQN